MSRLSLNKKTLLLGVTGLVPFLLLAYQYYLSLSLSITVSEVAIKEQDILIFIILSSFVFIYLLLGQYFESKNIITKIQVSADEMNIALYHQEYVPILDYIRKEKIQSQRTIENVVASISEVSSAAEMLVNMAQNSVEGSQQQSLSVNNIASAIEQMTASLKQVEEQADLTRQSSDKSSLLASEGENLSRQAITDIESIATSVDGSSKLILSLGERSQQIGSIIHVIEGISEQTNLLALNAAIEAARAGEHGRGFSVVADEVRTLATRSHAAAAEVSEQIQKIQSEIQLAVKAMDKVSSSVEQGVELINQSGESLKKIKQGTNETSEMFTQINMAITEQGEVSRDIAKNIEEINQQSQKFNKTIDEVESTAEYLVTLSIGAKDILL
ncbi:MAG: methyl-accepting chemotaxis protein [Woeseiaceae bacterium]